MGTNFYLRKKLSEQEKNLAKQYIEEDKFDELKGIIPEEIHIGKRSGGWKFLWDAHYFKFFEPTKESLFEWLKSGQITDEYGQDFTFEQFINEELDGFLNEGHDIESYEKAYPSRASSYHSHEAIKRFIRMYPSCKKEINKHGEFYIDDLRFTIHEDFA